MFLLNCTFLAMVIIEALIFFIKTVFYFIFIKFYQNGIKNKQSMPKYSIMNLNINYCNSLVIGVM